jgi:hypothetical protein
MYCDHAWKQATRKIMWEQRSDRQINTISRWTTALTLLPGKAYAQQNTAIGTGAMQYDLMAEEVAKVFP